MKKFLVVVLFCLPVFGQAAYSGRGLYSGSAAYGASVCGPGNGYSCFVSNTNVINYATPIPSWGPNTCDSTNMDTLSQCGNLTGGGVVNTPSDFGNAISRCTDMNTIRLDGGSVPPSLGNPAPIWTTLDAPSINAWNTDDTGIIVKVSGGKHYLMQFNPNTPQCTMTNPVLSFTGGPTWSYTVNNKVFSLSGTILSDNIVNLGAGSMTTSTKFDFNNSQCLINPVNGYTGGSFPQNGWTGLTTASLDDTTFAMAFSTLPGQGGGIYLAVWTVGQTGCDLYNALTGTITHNGTLLGTIPDTQWGGAYGGKADRFYLHGATTTLNPEWVTLSATLNTFAYGTYNDGNYFWQKGTTNVLHCGIGAPDWKASTVYEDGDRVQPATAVNPGDYIYQIILPVSAGTSGLSSPTWNQIPGSDTTENFGTTNVPVWRNTGIGTAQEYFCGGHGWHGYLGGAFGRNVAYHSFVDPSVPLTKLAPPGISSVGDQHLGITNGNATDTNWGWVISTDVGTATNLLAGPLPSALYDEGFLLAPPYKPDGSANCVYDAITCPTGTLGQVRRAFHTFNSGWHQTFDVQNNIAMLSRTGNFALLSTDGMGQFGNRSGQASCNVGAPNWSKSDSTHFVVGAKMLPNPQLTSNAGNYIYQVQSCSGACTTGTSQPTWTQSPTVAGVGTISDGTITWVAAPDVNAPANTAAQNCRADVMVVKLTR